MFNNTLDFHEWKQQTVRLYYLGGFPDNPDVRVQSKGRAFALPPVGEYLELPRWQAEDLLRRNVMYFSLDPRHAEWVKNGGQASEALAPQKPNREQLLEMFSREELLEALGLDDDAPQGGEPELEPEVAPAPAAPPSSNNRKNKKQDAVETAPEPQEDAE